MAAQRVPFNDLYVPLGGALGAPHDYLNRTVLVELVRGQSPADLGEHLATRLAHLFGMDPADYQVFPMDDRVHQFFVICPTRPMMLNMARRIPYSLGVRRIMFRLTAWSRDVNMIRDRNPIQAWISIRALPLQDWDRDGIDRVVSGFGYVVEVLPHGFQTGQFELITCQIMGRYGHQIPERVRYRRGSNVTYVDIIIHEVRATAPGPFPPPQGLNRLPARVPDPDVLLVESSEQGDESPPSGSVVGSSRSPL